MALSLIGVYYLNHKHDKTGFFILGLSALLWSVYDLSITAYEQALTTFVSALTSFYGYIRWRSDERT